MEGRAGEGAHVAGKIRVPGSAQAPSVPLNISPMVWLRQPAPIKIGVPRGRGCVRKSGAAIGDCWETHLPKGFSLRRGSAAGGGEARNPPLPVADIGGCSANEATSFASVSVAKRLCRIVRVVAATAALPFNRCDNDHCVVYTSPPPTAEPLLKEKPLGGCTL